MYCNTPQHWPDFSALKWGRSDQTGVPPAWPRTETRQGKTMAAAWSEDVSICMRTPLPPVPLQITRTMLNGGGSDVIRQCCCWSERRHQSSPSVPVVNLYHSSVTSLESQTNVTYVLMWPFDVHRGCFTERIHASQNKVTSNRTRCNQSCVTETNRFGLQLSCLWLGYLDEMSLLLLSYLVNHWLQGNMKVSNPFSPSFHPWKVSHPSPRWTLSYNCMCDSYHVCTDGTAHPVAAALVEENLP